MFESERSLNKQCGRFFLKTRALKMRDLSFKDNRGILLMAFKKGPEEIVFVEIKSGNATLSTVERKLRDVIKEKKVSWQEYRTHK